MAFIINMINENNSDLLHMLPYMHKCAIVVIFVFKKMQGSVKIVCIYHDHSMLLINHANVNVSDLIKQSS